MTVRILVLQHDADDPPLRLGDWLVESGAELDVRRCFDGHDIPADAADFDAVISLGGWMGAMDDAVAPWLPSVRAVLAAATRNRVPTLGICLGGQLLATATGGTVRKGQDGPEIGAYLTAKRDAADTDPLFGDIPMTPDVMQYHYDAVDRLPPGAVLLLSAATYPHQAFRVGDSAWGLQFHIEAGAATLREWAATEGISPTGRLGPMLDVAEDVMGEVWRAFAHRFVDLAASRAAPAASPLVGRRLPLAEPAAGTVQPTAGTAQPTAGTAQPTAGTVQPTAGQAEPTAGTAQPTAGQAEPAAGQADPP